MFERIDAHHHLWDHELPWMADPALAPLRRAFTADDLAAAARGIDRTIAVQAVSDADETAALLAVDSPLIAGVVGWVDLTAPAVAFPGGKLVGIRHQVQDEPDPEWLCRDDVRRGLRAVSDAGLVYDLLTLPHQLPAAIATVRALPELQFVVDYLSKPPIAGGELEPWATQMRELAAFEHVACKLSGMVTEADWASWAVDDLRPYFEVVLEAFGPSRLLFGSDWPVCTLAASYEQVLAAAEALTAELSTDERAKIFGSNARRIYTLA